MDIKTLSTQSAEALERLLAETETELRELRFRLASHQLKQVRQVRELRKRAANIHRILCEKK
ncbi:50S ribosomal protein L29 [Candidatus Uhrbacteria bacterium RIFOXYB12_FULL_58_10]|uniref:Large ribosomal subunit protein uL29 n=1 Tax=Candidatus Uhrbacteria bacterium RIFOXYB2_FULL_57_15 TaxID=1802422 RepID=A0A1F7WA17_9BACT|nr:MAG: 50S ribosomal protein L29 [Candidatus Uhrbacteria bacterium RIFOXYB12_FULL_58_10]OGL99027.1 MAG: 50S ribosomal protein L29 [Candidatus Uhrbacteria bacterium RIFOXYB2_FULL_57_15]OGM00247.1 MAG: 50S ribosomal protein L29 [Candidatus Uhrbacteria bacterium RIFOXYC12_FULL_57_11]